MTDATDTSLLAQTTFLLAAIVFTVLLFKRIGFGTVLGYTVSRAAKPADTANLFSPSPPSCCRVFCHPQVVEDEAGVEAQFAHHFGDGLSRFLERLEDAHREAA